MSEEIGLFPVFDVPDIEESEEQEGGGYKRSVFFDMETGDFRRDGAGRMTEAYGYDAFRQWCTKIALTPRYCCLAYPDEIGTELEEAMDDESTEAVESSVEREITDALMVHPKTESVEDFIFKWDGEELYCTFTVKGKGQEEFDVKNIRIGMGG